MSNQQLPQLDKFITPVGLAHYAQVRKPSEKYHKFNCAVEITKAQAIKLKKQFKALLEEHREAVKKAKNKKRMKDSVHFPIYKEEGDNGEVKFYVKATRESSYENNQGETVQINIPCYDAKGNLIEKKVLIGNGSKIRMSIEPRLYCEGATGYGLSFRLMAVQVIELVAYSGGGPATFESSGFEKTDGFEYDADDYEDEDADEPESDFEDKEDNIEDEAEKPEKRGRGRPKKQPDPEPEDSEEEEDWNGETEDEEEEEEAPKKPTKKGRGRPKKQPDPEPEPEEDEEEEEDEGWDDEEEEEDDDDF